MPGCASAIIHAGAGFSRMHSEIQLQIRMIYRCRSTRHGLRSSIFACAIYVSCVNGVFKPLFYRSFSNTGPERNGMCYYIWTTPSITFFFLFLFYKTANMCSLAECAKHMQINELRWCRVCSCWMYEREKKPSLLSWLSSGDSATPTAHRWIKSSTCKSFQSQQTHWR